MSTDVRRASADRLSMTGAAAMPVGALGAWLALEAVDPAGWPAGALLAAIAFLPLLGVALRRRAAAVTIGVLGAIAVLAGVLYVRGAAPSAVAIGLSALLAPFLVGFGYALSEPEPESSTVAG